MVIELLGIWMGFALCLLLSCQSPPRPPKLPKAKVMKIRHGESAGESAAGSSSTAPSRG